MPSRNRTTLRGSFDDFLAALLVRESGIDPHRHGWYAENFDLPVIDAARVTQPGRVARDGAGAIVFERKTIRQHFADLGVADLFDPHSSACIPQMQCRCMNALGFVGYMLGEQILVDTGYYVPETISRTVGGETRQYRRYYIGSIAASAWGGGKRELIYRPADTSPGVIGTDVNCWRGTFTGKDGVLSLEDLLQPSLQTQVMHTILRHNFAEVVRKLRRTRRTWRRLLIWRLSSDADAIPQGISVSGILAAAHLCGVQAAADYVRDDRSRVDEYGTPLEEYVERFSGYATPFDK